MITAVHTLIYSDDATADMGFGVGLEIDVPGTDPILIYQPRHATAYRR